MNISDLRKKKQKIILNKKDIKNSIKSSSKCQKYIYRIRLGLVLIILNFIISLSDLILYDILNKNLRVLSLFLSFSFLIIVLFYTYKLIQEIFKITERLNTIVD